MKIIKSITAKEIYRLYLMVKKKLWGNIWNTEYFVSMVGKITIQIKSKITFVIKVESTLNYIKSS